ncbi:ABC transporter permease [Mucilaginibacter sp. RCC_168]|uniref:ABC transporter permease n=1 Tax=Mucilaginibacter sp. RCC_168 TaxID=3239221 RepID=UPI0035250866
MLRNYLKIFYRANKKSKLSFFITVLGFAIGLASTLLIFIYVYYEYSYESMYSKKDRIYRISATSQMQDKSIEFAANVPALAPALNAAIPEIEKTVRINKIFFNGSVKARDSENIRVDNLLLADSTFFDVFDFHFIEGGAEAFKEPGMIVLTASLAGKIFGNKKAVDQTLYLNDKLPLKVGAVIEDPPGNTHLKFEGLVSWATSPEENVWNDAHSYTYLLVNKKASVEVLKKKIDNFMRSNGFIASVEQSLGTKFICDIQKISDIHLHSNRHNELSENGSEDLLFILISIALFFLLISIFNYINISIATSLTRIKEIGVRKVFGSSANRIRIQFFVESFVIIIISFFIAFILVLLTLHVFNILIEQHLNFGILTDGKFLLLTFSLILFITIIAGSYTAFYLSSLNATSALNKKALSVGNSGISLRKILIVLQLTISTGVLICTILVINQLNYIINADIGFEKKNILVVEMPNYDNLPFLKQALSGEKEIVGLSLCDYAPSKSFNDEYNVESGDGSMRIYNFPRMTFDNSFVDLARLKIIKGRNFDPSFSSDSSSSFLVNESTVRFFGWKNAIGKKIEAKNYDKKGVVIGVVRDASFYSLHQKNGPLIISCFSPENGSSESLFIKYKTDNFSGFVLKVKRHFREAFGNIPFRYYTLDSAYDNLYRSDTRYKRVITLGAFFMLIVSSLGLYGLSSFVAARNRAQIGIRKVLGATVHQIAVLHIKNFFFLALIGCLISWPISYYASWKWLQTFTARVSISWWMFALSTVICLLVVIITTAYHAIKVSKINPADTIRE